MKLSKYLIKTLKASLILFIMFQLDISSKNISNTRWIILPAMLPEEQLLTISQSHNLFKKSLDPELPEIYDENIFIQLIIHAWQWDKNAMIQYARIQNMTHDKTFLRKFYRKNAHLIVDHFGFRLKRPDIFDMNYNKFITKLADMHYPLAALLASQRLDYSAGVTRGNFNPLKPNIRNKIIHYIKIAKNGGYRVFSILADDIIFATGFAFHNRDLNAINSLKDRIPTLTQQELSESFEAYKVSALHNSQYAQIRLSEFYFYGAGIDQDFERAWAWALVARNNFVEFQKKHAGKKHNRERIEYVYNVYNLDMMSKMETKHLTKSQQEYGIALATEIKASIVTEDYYQWASEIDPIPPMP